MSIVTVQLGQCGNQVGQELFDVIGNDIHDAQRYKPTAQGKAYHACSQERFLNESITGGSYSAPTCTT